MKKFAALVCAAALLNVFGISSRVVAQDFSICDGFQGLQAGLCRAGAAIGCSEESADHPACIKIEETFVELTGENPPWIDPEFRINSQTLIFDVEELNLETGIVIGDLPESACDPVVNLNTNDLMFCFNGARMNPATFFHERTCLVGTVLRDRDSISFSASFLLQGTEFSTVTEADAIGQNFTSRITNEEIFNDDTILLYTCEGNLFKIGNVICNAGDPLMYPDCQSPDVLTDSVAFDYKLLGVDGYVGGPTCPPFCAGGL